MSIQVIWHSIPEIGYFARTTTRGEEFDMVSNYVEQLKRRYEKLKTKNATIFVEPQLESGYPDLVIVEYTTPPINSWNPSRFKLNCTDLRILMQIQLLNIVSLNDLSNLLGFSIDEIRKSTDLLAECGLIHISKTRKFARKVSIKKWCRIRKIISVEAKIGKWNSAILQAEANAWFATDSYIMLNKRSCNTTILQRCATEGIGILLHNEETRQSLASSHRTFPVSYASLLFNEWIQRIEHMEVLHP